MKSFFRFLLQVLFRFRAYDMDALKTPGPVLLIPNHLSWIDWLFLWVCLDEDWKFVTSSISAQTSWLHRKLMINHYTLPIDTSSPYAVKRMAEFLKGGGRLVLFAEGRLSRTGTLMKLFDGTGFLIFKTKAKVITAYLRGAGCLPFSPNPGWKKCFPKVTAHFSATLAPPELGDISTRRARALLTGWLRDQMVRQQFEVEMTFGPQNVLSAVAETARKHPGHIILEDATHANADLSEAHGGGGRAGACLAWHSCGWRACWPVDAQCQRHTGCHPRVVEPGQSARRAELLLGHTHHAGVRGTGRTKAHRHLARLS